MIFEAIERLIDYSIKKNLITLDDVYFVRNRLIDLFRLSEWRDAVVELDNRTVDEILSPMLDYAVEKGIISDTVASRDLFDTRIMGLVTPMPREVIADFNKRYEISPDFATEWYYRFSRDVNYVRAGRMERDLRWKYSSEYGELDITVNLSKPEKDPRDIAAARNAKASGYPKCALCIENSGLAGDLTHQARQNLIPIPVTVGGEDWYIQYSPYGYYNEHCIALSNRHSPMVIDKGAFVKLFDIIDYIPHYFIGSNADLPIVGGSILSHEHFQGGRYSFAMDNAPIEEKFEVKGYPGVEAGIVKWPMSVIRLSSSDRDSLTDCCVKILDTWRRYSDESAFIYSHTDGVPHNTITPIARREGDKYVCDLVLRNNITTSDRPLGIYHPSPELHHIKKENIGLIEVMGLAVLPSRLKGEIDLLSRAMLNGDRVSDIPEIAHHGDWAEQLIRDNPSITPSNVMEIIRNGIGEVFLKVLLDAGVYKRTPEGKAAFMRFVDQINA